MIDVQGFKKITEQTEAYGIFITPPSQEVLKKRVFKRGGCTPEALSSRLAISKEEIAKSHIYDKVITNQDLERAYWELEQTLLFS